ncbi:MAG: LPD38 domain-containing protein [Macromonas sp.]
MPRNAPAKGIHVGIARAALAQAYGDLPDQLERKGLLAVSQTLGDAIDRAAQMRADATGQSFEQARQGVFGGVSSNLTQDQTQTEAFWRWFGNSKVVDADGKPLAVYHGTNADVAEFRQPQRWLGNGELLPTGVHFFAKEPAVATAFAENRTRLAKDGSPNVIPVFLKAANPIDLRNMDSVRRVLELANMDAPASMKVQQAYSLLENQETLDVIKSMGHDGALLVEDGRPFADYRNAQDKKSTATKSADFSHTRNFDAEVIAVFDPTQIKSAIGNNGNFDPQDANILRSTNGDVQAFFDPQTGTAHMVADNLSADSAPGVMMHEVGIHMAADGSMQPIFNRAKMLLRAQKADPFIQRVQARLDAAGESSGEEAAAYMVEEYERDRLSAPASVRRWLETALATVKAWLNRKGIIGADKLTVADIAAVARANARTAAHGDVGVGVKFSRAEAVFDWSNPGGPGLKGSHIRTKKIGNTTIDYGVGNGTAEIISVRTPAAKRGAGSARTALTEFLREADGRGLQVKLQASALDKKTSTGKLVAFYKSLGFELTGVKINAAGDPEMIRPPSPISDIRFSRTPQWQEPKEQPQAEQPPTWAAPEDTRWDYLTYNLQDRQIDTKRVQQSIEANNGPLPDELNVRQREELFYGRDAKEVQDFRTQELNPMLEQLGKDGIELPEFEEYLHARHAPEANRVMAERNPNQEMINVGRATAAQEIFALAKKIEATKDKGELRILNKAMGNAMADLSRWRKVKPYGGSEESRLALSGMSNQQAQEIMDGLTPDELAGMERSAAMFDAIVAKNRALMVEYGLESRDTVEGWADLFQHYVPLMREEAEGAGLHNGLGTGQGFSIKGREVKSRTGSAEKKVVDIVANLAMQRERTITRGEKNRVAATMIELARANPNPDFWKVGAPDRKRVYDRATRTVKWVTDADYKQSDNVVVAKFVKDNGQIEEVALTFNESDPRAMRMATAFKNLDDASLNKPLRIMAPFTRTLAALSTQYNPMWGIFNFTRDTFGLMISLGNTPLSPLMPKKIIETDSSKTTIYMGSTRMRIYKDAWAMLPALYRGARAERNGQEDTSETGKLWEDFQKTGGAIGFRDMLRTSGERTDLLKTVVDPDAWMETPWGKALTLGGTIKPLAGAAKRGFEALSNLISDFNLALENAVRVATYKAALDQGLSKEQAASIAKNITVNFNRRGAVGHQIGAGWAFFNASVQGSARMADALTVMGRPGDPRSIRLSDFGKAVVYGGLAIGALQALALAAAGFEDDEPPEFVRDRNLTIPTGWTGVGPDKGYITLPMPLGYNIIPAFGRRLTEFVLAGGEDPFKHATGMVGLVFDGFNPIGSGSFTQMVMPTLLDPIAAAIENTDSFGRPIARETMDRNIPGHQMARDAATDAARLASRAINYISGGDEYTAGKWSPSPDQLDYVVGQYGGGVARELIKLWQLASGTARGEDVPFNKVPLLGRFAGSADSASSQGNAYYSNINKIDQAEKRIKGLTEDGKRSEAQAERRKPEALLIAKAKVAEREVTRLRQEKRRLLEAGAERAKVRAVEAKITDAMRRLNEAAKARGI